VSSIPRTQAIIQHVFALLPKSPALSKSFLRKEDSDRHDNILVLLNTSPLLLLTISPRCAAAFISSVN
jgi:hypothetical protein